ncbi:hypothetical protein [Lacibacter sp.]|uniref:hypothetical protein n=1 Tax=Lacibacter sp. TaxID=1915409 RepID=UPI002B4AFA28|nr:hypothetical protein [Lacibacter sp.]HLP39804.1 hypothetical protein [Lacibacter sp.]
MQKQTIIGIRRGNMFSVYSIGLLGIILIFGLLHFFVKFPLEKLINPFSLIPISILLIGFLLSFLKFLDKKQMIIIDSKGVSMRKSRFPFSGLEQIDWNDIQSYNAKVEQFRNGATNFLVIKRKSRNKKYYVDLFDIETNNGDILAALRNNSLAGNSGETDSP